MLQSTIDEVTWIMRLTVKAAADRLGVSIGLIYQLCRSRQLKHYRIGLGRRGKILIDEADLQEFVEIHAVGVGESITPMALKHIRVS